MVWGVTAGTGRDGAFSLESALASGQPPLQNYCRTVLIFEKQAKVDKRRFVGFSKDIIVNESDKMNQMRYTIPFKT